MWRRCGFLGEEHDIFLATFDQLQSVARHSDKMGNIDHCERIGTANFQVIAGRQGL